MRRGVVAGLAALALAGGIGAANLYDELQIDEAVGREYFFEFVQTGQLLAPASTAAMHGLSGARRAAAVQFFGSRCKEWFGTPDFRAFYEKKRKERIPEKPRLRTPEEIVAELDREQAQGIAEAERNAQGLPKEMRAEALAMVAAMKASQRERPPPDLEQIAEQEKERFAEETAGYQARIAELPPADPKAALRKSLEGFLALTADIDFNAKLVERDGRRFFADPALQQKPSDWKKCFRAGKEATAAARAFAKAWLAELK